MISFVISFILTWTIGLAPPLFIRFILIKRPLSKFVSILIAVLFYFLNLLLFISMGSQSKTHTALFIIAIVSYYILQKDKKHLPEPALVPQSSWECPACGKMNEPDVYSCKCGHLKGLYVAKRSP